MPKKNLINPRKINPQVQESTAPELLRITLQVLRLVNAAPVQLRRVAAGWRLAVRPSRLENFRFLIAIMLDMLVLCCVIIDLAQKNPGRRLHVKTDALSSFINFTDQLLLLLRHMFSEQYLMYRMTSLITTLQQLEKMNITFKSGWYSTRHQKIKVSVLITIIAWTFLSVIYHIFSIYYAQWNNVKKNNPALFAVVVTINVYVFMSSTINQLWWGIIIAELSYTITGLNKQISHLLHRNTTDPEDIQSRIRFLRQSYETLYDTVRRFTKDSGMFFLFLFMSKFSKLLVTPYYLMKSLGLSTNISSATITQINWCIFHVVSLVIIVEPCHWAQDQMERTHDLLIRLARRVAQRHGRISNELNIFLLQVQMRGNSFTPMGVFKISRPLVATIFSAVTTYLAIVLQSQNDYNVMI